MRLRPLLLPGHIPNPTTKYKAIKSNIIPAARSFFITATAFHYLSIL